MTHNFPWRLLGWSIPLALLCIPLVARFPWSPLDYAVMGLLLVLTGLAMELGIRASAGSIAYRIGACAAILAAFLLVWVNGAVGILGDGNNPANLMFGGVIAVAGLGAVLARFKPAGLARAMFTAAAAQMLVCLLALAAGWTASGAAGVREVVLGIGGFGGLWLLSAGLFQKASTERAWTRPR